MKSWAWPFSRLHHRGARGGCGHQPSGASAARGQLGEVDPATGGRRARLRERRSDHVLGRFLSHVPGPDRRPAGKGEDFPVTAGMSDGPGIGRGSRADQGVRLRKRPRPPRKGVGSAPVRVQGGDVSGSFASILEGCRPLFPPELLDSGGWERLLDRARRLPRSVLDTHFGFEFHLGEPSPDADLFVVVLPGSDLSRHYIREGARAERGSPSAALAAGTARTVWEPDSYLARSVSGVVLEYDLAGLAPGPADASPRGSSCRRGAPPPDRGTAFPGTGIPRGLLAALAAAVGWNGHEELLGTVRAHLRGAAGKGLRVPLRAPSPARSPPGIPDSSQGHRQGGGSRPAGAGGMARPDGRGGGRARLDGRSRRLHRREPGRDRAGDGTAARSGAVPPPEMVRGRSHGMAPPSSPGSRSSGGAFPRKPRGCGAGRAPNGCTATQSSISSARASTTSRPLSNRALGRWRRPTSA